MDAVKFIEERRRMYRTTGKHAPTLAEWIPAEDVVKEVEEWSAAHPRKTRQNVFLERYPEAQIGDNGVLCVCPATISPLYRKDGGGCRNIHRPCGDCRREFWTQGVE